MLSRKIFLFTKGAFLALLACVFLLAVGVTIFVLTFDLNRYKDFAERKLTQVLQHPVTMESMHIKLSLVPTITINGFKVSNNEPFKDKTPLLIVPTMNAELELAPLLARNIDIHSVNLSKAEVHLFKNGTKNNWSIVAPQNLKKNAASNVVQKGLQNTLRLNLANIRELQVTYENEKQKQKITINNLELKQLYSLKGELLYNKQNFNFQFLSDSFLAFLNQTPDFPIDIKIQSRLLNLSVNGKIGDLKEWTGLQATLSVKTNSLKNLLNLFDIKNDYIPSQGASVQFQALGNMDRMDIKQLVVSIDAEKDLKKTDAKQRTGNTSSNKAMSFNGTGVAKNILKKPTLDLTFNSQLLSDKLASLWSLKPMSVGGNLSIGEAFFSAKNIVVDANRSDAKLNVTVRKAAKIYNVTMDLVSDYLDIADFWRKTEAKSGKTGAKAGKNQDSFVFPWDKLGQYNANLNLNIHHLQTAEWLVQPIGFSSRSTLTNGLLNVPFEIKALQGNMTGSLEGKVASKSLALNLRGKGLDLDGIRPLQTEVKDVVVDANVSMNTKGQTVPEVIRNLSGRVVLQTSQGQIINKWLMDLPQILNLNKKQTITASTTDRQINIICGAVNMAVNKGIVQGKDQIAIETNAINLMAGGTIDLNKKTMDFSLYPSLQDGGKPNDVLSLSKFIRVSGPFNNLTPKVDTEKVASNLIQNGLGKLMKKDQTTTQKSYVQGQLCKNVLGKQAIQAITTPTQKKSTTTQTPRPVQKTEATKATTPESKPFQQQLLNSLFQALGK